MAVLRKNLLSVLALGVVLAFLLATPTAAAARHNDFKYVSDGHGDITSVVDVVPTDVDNPYLRGYAQWVKITFSLLKADASVTLTIRNAGVSWGKWYDCHNKDNEVYPPSDVEITSTSSPTVCACGREDSPSGVTGSLDLYRGDVKVVHVSFDNPFGLYPNIFKTSEENNDYVVSVEGANLGGGALGNVKVRVVPLF